MGAVFPACAGMIPAPRLRKEYSLCVPRMRGDDPYWAPTGNYNAQCSPHARG